MTERPSRSSAPEPGPLPPEHPLITGATGSSPLVRAYRGDRPRHRPVWFMRQAGRSLPEYRQVREGVAMLDACLRPDLAAEITVQPVRRHGVDAAIFFSDIVVPLRLAGVGVDIVPGVGPVLEHPVRTADDVAALPELDPDALGPIREAVGLTVGQLGATPLIGFAGAPFTVASYLVEGRPSREYRHIRALMHDDPQLWHRLLGWVARTAGSFLRAQALAGASALQLFDSWAGALTPPEYREYAAPHSAAVLAHVADLGVPRVHFGTGTRPLLTAMRDAGADVVGIDATTPLSEAVDVLGRDVPVQGNIAPEQLSQPWPVIRQAVEDALSAGQRAAGHVVNLGHGVPPDTDPDVLTRIVELVHSRPDPNGGDVTTPTPRPPRSADDPDPTR